MNAEGNDPPPPPSGPRILVVEDDDSVRGLFRDALPFYWKATAVTTPNVEEALHRLEEEDFDAVVLDLNVPGGGGEAFYRRIEQEGRPLARRVLFVTGATDTPGIDAICRETGNRIVRKPFAMKDLLDVLETLLAKDRG